jgi:hypothetical protein
MLRVAPLLTAFAVLLGVGAVYGMWTDRWKTSNEPQASAARVKDVSMILGDWDGKSQELDARQLEAAEIVGHIYREYTNRRTGDVITVLLVCGRPGPISVHTPDVCFRGMGYDFRAPTVHYKLEADGDCPAADFNLATMQKGGPLGSGAVRLFWGWSADGTWKAPDWPRLVFGRKPALFKLYVLRRQPRADEPLAEDPCIGFLRLLLPELQRSLFSPS